MLVQYQLKKYSKSVRQEEALQIEFTMYGGDT